MSFVRYECGTFITRDSQSEHAMCRVNFKIDSEKKDKITQYVEQSKEYSSISHFFRLAANKEMSDDDEQSQEIPPEVDRTLDQITTELKEIRDGMNQVSIQLESRNRDTETLAQEVYESIPRAPAANSAEISSTSRSAQEMDYQHAYSVLQNSEEPSTMNEITRELNADKEEIKEAIHHLKSNFLPILELVDEDGNKHILKQEERR